MPLVYNQNENYPPITSMLRKTKRGLLLFINCCNIHWCFILRAICLIRAPLPTCQVVFVNTDNLIVKLCRRRIPTWKWFGIKTTGFSNDNELTNESKRRWKTNKQAPNKPLFRSSGHKKAIAKTKTVSIPINEMFSTIAKRFECRSTKPTTIIIM